MATRKDPVLPYESENQKWCQQLAGRVIRARKLRGWSQAELGQHIGISQSLVATMENHPDVATIKRLITALRALDLDLQVAPRKKTKRAAKKKADCPGPKT